METSRESLRSFLNELSGLEQTDAIAISDEPNIPEVYQVVVECDSEDEQRQVYMRMRDEGRRCRVLTI